MQDARSVQNARREGELLRGARLWKPARARAAQERRRQARQVTPPLQYTRLLMRLPVLCGPPTSHAGLGGFRTFRLFWLHREPIDRFCGFFPTQSPQALAAASEAADEKAAELGEGRGWSKVRAS